MKLFHFKPVKEADKARKIGRLLARPAVPFMETEKTPQLEKSITGDDDNAEKMRDYAFHQLEKTHPHIHKKIKHFD